MMCRAAIATEASVCMVQELTDAGSASVTGAVGGTVAIGVC